MKKSATLALLSSLGLVSLACNKGTADTASPADAVAPAATEEMAPEAGGGEAGAEEAPSDAPAEAPAEAADPGGG